MAAKKSSKSTAKKSTKRASVPEVTVVERETAPTTSAPKVSAAKVKAKAKLPSWLNSDKQGVPAPSSDVAPVAQAVAAPVAVPSTSVGGESVDAVEAVSMVSAMEPVDGASAVPVVAGGVSDAVACEQTASTVAAPLQSVPVASATITEPALDKNPEAVPLAAVAIKKMAVPRDMVGKPSNLFDKSVLSDKGAIPPPPPPILPPYVPVARQEASATVGAVQPQTKVSSEPTVAVAGANSPAALPSASVAVPSVQSPVASSGSVPVTAGSDDESASPLLGAPNKGVSSDWGDEFLAQPEQKVEDEHRPAEAQVKIVGEREVSVSQVDEIMRAIAAARAKATATQGQVAPKDEVVGRTKSECVNGLVHETVKPTVAKLKDEVQHLTAIVESVESLDYLRARMKRVTEGGCEMSDLVGLYRIVSQTLFENMKQQAEAMRKMRDRYEKRLAQVTVDQSSEFVRLVQAGKDPKTVRRVDPVQRRFEEPKVQSEAESESGTTGQLPPFIRRQLEIKDELLLKARQAQDEAEARYDKLKNDVKNIRSRQEKDMAIQMHKQRESLFSKIIPTLDSFDSALLTSDSFVNVADVVEGLSNIHKQLLSACESEGLVPLETKGQLFDPNKHEAVGIVKTTDVPEETIVLETRKGYTLDDKLLRAAMVQIARP